MLEASIAKAAATMSKKLGYETSQEEILRYSMTILTTTVFGYLIMYFMALVLGLPKVIMTAAFSAGCLRIYSGGAHASAPERCVAIGVIIFSTLGYLANLFGKGINLYCAILLAIIYAIYTIYKYAPADAPGKPIETVLERSLMRRKAYTMLMAWCLIVITSAVMDLASYKILLASCFGVIWQSFSLTPLGYTVTGKYLDGFLKIFIRTKEVI